MEIIKRIYSKLVVGSIKETDFEPNVDEWYAFLDKLPEPQDYIDEAYNKFLCRNFHYGKLKSFILDFCALPLLAAGVVKSLFVKKHLPEIDGKKLIIERKRDVAFEDIFPEELYGQYDTALAVEDLRNKKELNFEYAAEAKEIFSEVYKRYWNKPYFMLWCYRELGKHSEYILQYNPSSIAVYVEERNIAGPLIRKLYESTGRKYISFMHGEYLLRLIQAYMSFSEYYIWHPSYVETFGDILHCNIGKYVLYRPKKLQKKWDLEKDIPDYYCTYYFSAESKESIRKIGEIFKQLEEKGKKCKVRPHPRYSQLQEIEKNFSKEMIEDPKQVSIETSLRRTKYVVGLATTVLAEGYYEGREIVIDDIGSPEKYGNLVKRRFVTLSLPHILLSELVAGAMKEVQGE